MNKAIIGKKIGMTQLFNENGVVIPVTVIEAGPCPVVQKKSIEKDGYESLQIAFDPIKASRVNKPLTGHFAKAKVEPSRYLKEVRLDDISSYQVGSVIECDIFKVGDRVDIQGKSKGHGFTGTIKRWNFHIGPKAHGSGYHRGVGSMGACSTPSKVIKNKKMPGHYGYETVTIQNLEVVKVIKKVEDNLNLILVKGSIPGAKGGVVLIKQSCKN